MSHSHRQGHGNVQLARAIVAILAIAVLGVDWLVYRQANLTPFPFPGIQVTLVISAIWLVFGAAALCMRQAWGRAIVLTILVGGAIGFFVVAVITIGGADPGVFVRIKPLALAIFVYFVAILFVSNSKDIRRLTSRAWE